jgi:predicted ATPase/DNA-binding CsgD family transcriptional regulator
LDRFVAPAQRHNLPLQLTSFIGREHALDELGHLLAGTRLLTLVGPPGVGKTRLALRLAGEALDAYADGVWLVELAPLVDPVLVPQTVAAVLGVQEETGRPLLDTLVEALRSKQQLLVLDNCEHLVAVCAALADRLLRTCRHLEILATSREALGIAGETAWWVPTLTVPDRLPASAADGLGPLNQSEAVRLFVERARTAMPTFALTELNAGAVVQVCSRLDGIALALELAAARMRALSVEQLSTRLDAAITRGADARTDDPFRLLAAGSRAALPRQQTLRAAIDWSYELLTDAEQLLLCRLAVFAGGWTLEAAEQVCAGDGIAPEDVLDLLVQLVNKSLVAVEIQAETQRYRLLEMIRQYAQEKLHTIEGGEDAVRRRHLHWLMALVEQAPRLFRGPDEKYWLDRFEQELDNLRAALTWSRRQPDDAQVGMRLAGATWTLWYRHGRLTEGRGWLEAALAASSEETPARAMVLLGACGLAHVQGDTAHAEVLIEQGRALGWRIGDTLTQGLFAFAMSRVAHSRGDRAGAATLAEESLELFRGVGDRLGAAVALGALGFLAHELGDFERAEAHYEDGLALYRELADPYGIAWSLHYLGLTAHAQGDGERATPLFEEGLRLRREIKDSEGVAGSLEGLAAIAGTRGLLARGARLLGVAEALRQAIGAPVPMTERPAYDSMLTRVRDGLQAEAFAAAWAEGQAMSLNDAVAYALATEEPALPVNAVPVRPPVASPPGGLSRRELDVTMLIAQGHTNRQIAEQLVISEWTVDTHVRHILTKLNVRSRTQVAAWATEQGLPQPNVG